MLVGFNTAVHYRDAAFHVQTEDGGNTRPVITTQLFYRGAVITSARSDYASNGGALPAPEEIRQLMECQHRAAIERLRAGALDAQIPGLREEDASPNSPAPASATGAPRGAAPPLRRHTTPRR